MFIEIFSTVIFFLAIFHFLFSNYFLKFAHLEKKNGIATLYSFLGNVTLIFGLWLIPIFITMTVKIGWQASYSYLASIDLKEPFSYFVLIALATCRPLRNLFDALMQKIASRFQNQVLYYWMAMILFSSIAAGIFSGIGIMALVCFHASTSFFKLKPSNKLSYFTLAMLLLGISAGATIIPFNYSFFLDNLSGDWTHLQVFYAFGWKVFLALFCLCMAGGYLFRREFSKLKRPYTQKKKLQKITLREIFYALLFFVASSFQSNVYILLLVLGVLVIFHKSAYHMKGEEGKLTLYTPIAIAFFTYTLEIHAGLQKWWATPIFEEAQGAALYFYSYFLTGLNEHVPLVALKDTLQGATKNTQFLSMLGVLAGGALTLIAKSANIIAKLNLKKHFPHKAISPIYHLLIAVPIGLFFSIIILLFHYLGGNR